MVEMRRVSVVVLNPVVWRGRRWVKYSGTAPELLRRRPRVSERARVRPNLNSILHPDESRIFQALGCLTWQVKQHTVSPSPCDVSLPYCSTFESSPHKW